MSDALDAHHIYKLVVKYEYICKDDQQIASAKGAQVREDRDYAEELASKFSYSGIRTVHDILTLRRKHKTDVRRFAELCSERLAPADHVPAGISLFYLWLYLAGNSGQLRDHMDAFGFNDALQDRIQAAYDTVAGQRHQA